MSPENITPEIIAFLTERHLASLTTLRKDGSPHVVPVGFSFDASCNEVLVITFAGSQKVKNAERGGRAVCEHGRAPATPAALRAAHIGD